MNRILIDGTFYQGKTQYHGGGEYGKAVLLKLLEKSGIDKSCGVFFFKNLPICGNVYDICREKNIRIHAISDIRNIPFIIKNNNYNVVYSAIPYRMWGRVHLDDNIRFICSFHGLRQLEYAEFEENEKSFFKGLAIEGSFEYLYKHTEVDKHRLYQKVYKDTLNICKNMKIITGSQHTKYSIYNYFPELQNVDIEVLHDPMKEQLLEITGIEENKIFDKFELIKNEYGLIISAGIWYKNGIRGILAYDYIYDCNYKFISPNFKTVVLGIKNTDEIVKRLKHPDRFVFLGYVDDVELEVLYKYAHLMLFMSLTEGYGYPALEAMKYGTLCLCSANTSIPEVCGDMVLYANPFLIDEICNRILQSFSYEIRAEKKKIIANRFPVIKEMQRKALDRIVEIICEEWK